MQAMEGDQQAREQEDGRRRWLAWAGGVLAAFIAMVSLGAAVRYRSHTSQQQLTPDRGQPSTPLPPPVPSRPPRGGRRPEKGGRTQDHHHQVNCSTALGGVN